MNKTILKNFAQRLTKHERPENARKYKKLNFYFKAEPHKVPQNM